MSHFAEINSNNEVIRVIRADNSLSNEGLDWIKENLGGNWVQTSYNASIREKFAAVGDKYDPEKDIFISNASNPNTIV